MSNYHPLTEIVYDDWHMKTGKDVMDMRIRDWLKEKCEILGVGTNESIEDTLELQEETLEEKFKKWSGKDCKLDDWFFSSLAKIAKEHYKE